MVFEEASFDGPGAAETPVGSDHLLDHAELHAIGGLETSEVVIHHGFEPLRGFLAHDDMPGEQAVTDGILRRTPFAFGGKWTFGASAIGLGS